MEIHRLTPIEQESFDSALFERLYKEVAPLKWKLVNQINPQLFGVDRELIASWFDDKILMVFCKYHGAIDEGRLKGNIITAISNFKNKILKKGYRETTENHCISIGEDNEIENFIIAPENEKSAKDLYLDLALSFMKNNLSEDALEVYNIIYNPPAYITSRLRSKDARIPHRLIADYLCLEPNTNSIRFIGQLREEIESAIIEAREFFSNQPSLA